MQVLPPKSQRLSVSIVVYNSELGLLAKTLASLRMAAELLFDELGLITRLILVDNKSASNYKTQLKKLLDVYLASQSLIIQFVELDTNIGFGAGHNRAIESLSTDFHLVLNPDVEMAEDALLRGLERLRVDASVALVSPRALGPAGEQEFLCKRYPSVLVLGLRAFAPSFVLRWFRRRLDHYELRDRCHSSSEASVPLASGCFMLVRRADLQAVGGFDESYFLYFEDFDLSIRLSAHGSLLYCPEVEIVHHGGYAGSKGFTHLKYFFRSALRFFHHHGWRWI